jgi:type II secretory pathway predicted ATPase ExeA
MYQEHFGLSKNPFQSIADGEGVFEGSEQAKVIASLKTALTAKDSIAVITGPVGVGKTTIVQRAIERMGPDRLVAILGRTQVGSDELVDLLLAQFGVLREPTRRFECLKTFNRILNERAEAGARVFIVIEDAERLGAELLEELEALTAADGGACAGANIVLMGPQKLDKLITKPSMERVRQRIRLQQTLERYSAEEVEAYLRHRIQAAGGDFDAIFEPGASLMVRRCSGGIPRVINSLCETALTMAAESKLTQVTGKIVFKVAVEVFGLSPGDTPTSQLHRTTPNLMATLAMAAQPATAKAPPPAPAKVAQPAPSPAATAKVAQPAPSPAATAKAPAPAASKPAPVAHKPASVAAAAIAPDQNVSDPTIPVRKMPSAAEAGAQTLRRTTPRAPLPPSNAAKQPAKPAAANGAAAPAARSMANPSRLPDLPGLGVQDKAKPAAIKPLPELPPKFKFADEIVVDRDTKPRLPVQPEKKIEPPVLHTLKLDDGKAKPAAAKPQTTKAPAADDDIPTLGDSARVKKAIPEVRIDARRPAANPAAAVNGAPAATSEGRSRPADHAEPPVDEPTASFAKVDHDMLEAALASLAVHDEEDRPPSVEAEMLAAADKPAPAPERIPKVTLDQSIEARRAEAKTVADPDKLTRMAAELEKTQSLEEMSDALAETLFGSEELEAISLQIREDTTPVTVNPVALEPDKAAAVTERPPAARPPVTPRAPAAPQPAANGVSAGASTAAAPPATEGRGPQPEPIESQFNTSMTATLKTLKDHGKSPPDDDHDEVSSGGLLSRLKDTFKS